MMNKKHNLKSGKAKIRKRDSKEKKTGNQRKEKRLIQKKLQLNVFDVVPFMKQKQRRKKRKEREKNKESKESKKKDKKEDKKKRTRERERDRDKEKLKKGEAKKG